MGVASSGADILQRSDRDRVLEAMADCCAELGYRATSVEEVLARSDVERSRFEALFADKEDCALAAINRLVSETISRVSIAGIGSSPEQRRTEMAAIVDLMVVMPGFARLVLIEARQGGTEAMHNAYRSATHVLALMMERAMGGPDDGARVRRARAALGGAEAVVRRELAAGRSAELPTLIGNFIYAALVPFVGQREALRQARLASGNAVKEG